MKRYVPLLIVLVCFAGITPIQRYYAGNLAGPENDDRIFQVPEDPNVTLAFSLGYETIWVDLFWVRLTQYFGGNYTTLAKYDWKRDGYVNLADTIIALDPNFYEAYGFIAFSILEGLRDVHLGTDYYMRGIEQFPHDWHYRYLYAFNLAFVQSNPSEEDYEKAIKALNYVVVDHPEYLPPEQTHVTRTVSELLKRNRNFCAALVIPVGKYQEAVKTGSTVNAILYQSQIHRIRVSMMQDNLAHYLKQYRSVHGASPEVASDLIGTVTEVQLAEFVFDGTTIVNMRACGAVAVPMADGMLADPRGGGRFVYVPSTGEIESSIEIERTWSDRIKQLEAQVVEGYKASTGSYPTKWEQLLENRTEEEKAEARRNYLTDPYGGRYELAGEGQVVHVIDADWWVRQMGPDAVIYRGQ